MSGDLNGSAEELAPPAVAPEVYDETYYLNVCVGSREWRESGGATPSGVYEGLVKIADVRPGDTLVDIGTGRGELLVAALQAGASQAIGIEYAPTAIDLARTTLDKHNITPDRGRVVLADARSVPLPDECADIVTLCDVVEHLTPTELAMALSQTRKLLRPGGRVFIHTFPNRLIYDATYRTMWWTLGRWRGWPRDPRMELERVMHVNEQTARSLRRALRVAGFDAIDVHHGEEVYTQFIRGVRTRRLMRALARFRPTRALAASDLYAHAVSPTRGVTP